ncbi:19756_t:CDS:2, partial [Racocetra fulgida]
MSSHGYNPNVHEATLPEDSNNTINPLLSEITAYFVDCGFQESLVRSFLEGEVHLDLRTNAELMFDFLEERQRLDPTIFVGIEGSGVSGIASGEDKRLLVKWGLTEEAASELRNNDFLSSNTKVADANTMCSTYRAFFHATNQQSAQAI